MFKEFFVYKKLPKKKISWTVFNLDSQGKDQIQISSSIPKNFTEKLKEKNIFHGYSD